MSEPSTAPDPLPGLAPVIPPPPPQQGRRAKGGDARGLAWLGALIVGVALGAGAYAWAPGFNTYVDDWVALALG